MTKTVKLILPSYATIMRNAGRRCEELAQIVANDVVPLRPFLEVRAKLANTERDGRSLWRRVLAQIEGLSPDKPEWRVKFNER